MISASMTRSLLVTLHFLTWASSAIVVGITAYFLHHFEHGQHLIYEIVIVRPTLPLSPSYPPDRPTIGSLRHTEREIQDASTLGLWIPSFILPILMPKKSFYLPLNFIYSYLWLTAFIFAAQDYNEGVCAANAPAGGRCAQAHVPGIYFPCFVSPPSGSHRIHSISLVPKKGLRTVLTEIAFSHSQLRWSMLWLGRGRWVGK